MANPGSPPGRVFRLAPAILGIASGLALGTGWGATWSEIDAGLPGADVNVRTIVVAGGTPSTIYASAIDADGSGHIFKTTDGAASWKALSSLVGASSVFVDPQNSSVVYALSGRGILKSTDGGAGWTRVGAGLPNTFVNVLAIDPATTSNLYAIAGGSGIFKSADAGVNWVKLITGLPPNAFFSSLLIDPGNPSNVYLTGSVPQNGGPANFVTARSMDGGATWNVLNGNLAPNASLRLVAIAATSSTLYGLGSLSGTGGAGQGLLKSTDAGQSWTAILPSIGEVCVQYERTCYEIVKCRRLTASNDKRFDLFVIGGGGRLRPLQEALRWHSLPGGFVREGWRQLQPPKRLKDRLAIQADYDFLANACGLASSLSWEYYPPSEVPPMASLPIKPKPDVEEYYPK
jgi:photosystem II stability/assembly factor-like uncharacterized protein